MFLFSFYTNYLKINYEEKIGTSDVKFNEQRIGVLCDTT